MYEAFTFCLIGAIIGYLFGFLYQNIKIKRLEQKIIELQQEYDKLLTLVTQ
jgi:hypothetical protein